MLLRPSREGRNFVPLAPQLRGIHSWLTFSWRVHAFFISWCNHVHCRFYSNLMHSFEWISTSYPVILWVENVTIAYMSTFGVLRGSKFEPGKNGFFATRLKRFFRFWAFKVFFWFFKKLPCQYQFLQKIIKSLKQDVN